MKKVFKSNKILRSGFTLLEMVLVIAIMLIMSTYLYSSFKVVNYSHLKVAVVNDMHDYASLTLHAIENHLINATSIGEGQSIKLSGDSSKVLINEADALPGFQQYHVGGTAAKWFLTLNFTCDQESKTVTVVLTMKDNAEPDSGVAYTDQITVYCACCRPDTFDDYSGSEIGFTTDPIPLSV